MNHGALNRETVDRQTVDHGDLVEISLANLREHPADAARWLAVEVLLSDEAALEDDDLVDGLCRLQDRLEALTRIRYGVALRLAEHQLLSRPSVPAQHQPTIRANGIALAANLKGVSGKPE
jgi:hypothetical protein